MLSDELAHPHDQSSANYKSEHHQDVSDDLGNSGAENNTISLRLEEEKVTNSVDQAQTKRKVTRNLSDATPARFALFSPAAYGRDNTLHQLHNDRCSDVRHNTQCKYREVRQSTASEKVEHNHRDDTLLRKRISKSLEWNARHRQVSAESVKHQDAKSEQDFIPELRYLERLYEGT